MKSQIAKQIRNAAEKHSFDLKDNGMFIRFTLEGGDYLTYRINDRIYVGVCPLDTNAGKFPIFEAAEQIEIKYENTGVTFAKLQYAHRAHSALPRLK